MRIFLALFFTLFLLLPALCYAAADPITHDPVFPLIATPEIWALRHKAEQGDASALASLQFKAEHGEARAALNLAMLYDSEDNQGLKRNEVEALKWYLKGAELGNVAAQFAAGARIRGHQGARWLRKASEQGLPVAQEYLAQCYGAGLGVKIDFAEAYFWNQLATDGHSDGYKSKLTFAQIATVKKRLKAWRQTHHQLPIPELL